jgi:hypothetical protein
MEIPLPQLEIEVESILLEENQTIQVETSKNERQRTIFVSETSIVKRTRGKNTIQPENIQEIMQTEQPSHENIQ